MSDHPVPDTRISPAGRLLMRMAPIEPREVPMALTALLLFFCVMGGYFAVRPVRETVGTLLGRERVADLFVVTWIASILIVPAYGALVARFRRAAFLPAIYACIALALALVGAMLGAQLESVRVGQFFYVF